VISFFRSISPARTRCGAGFRICGAARATRAGRGCGAAVEYVILTFPGFACCPEFAAGTDQWSDKPFPPATSFTSSLASESLTQDHLPSAKNTNHTSHPS
jgi:hypothetical protein